MLLVGIQESPREDARSLKTEIDNGGPATTTPTLSSRRFPPQSPAHPGQKQDDGARQVSWLPGLCFLSAFPELRSSGSWTDCSPVTVAGAAAVSNRVPIQIPCGNLARGRTIPDVSERSIRLAKRDAESSLSGSVSPPCDQREPMNQHFLDRGVSARRLKSVLPFLRRFLENAVSRPLFMPCHDRRKHWLRTWIKLTESCG